MVGEFVVLYLSFVNDFGSSGYCKRRMRVKTKGGGIIMPVRCDQPLISYVFLSPITLDQFLPK